MIKKIINWMKLTLMTGCNLLISIGQGTWHFIKRNFKKIVFFIIGGFLLMVGLVIFNSLAIFIMPMLALLLLGWLIFLPYKLLMERWKK